MRVGVTWQPEERRLLRELVEGGNLLEAQRLILAKLTEDATRVERLERAVVFAYERGYRDGIYGRPLDTAATANELIAQARPERMGL